MLCRGDADPRDDDGGERDRKSEAYASWDDEPPLGDDETGGGERRERRHRDDHPRKTGSRVLECRYRRLLVGERGCRRG
jgi:hypothetical protein